MIFSFLKRREKRGNYFWLVSLLRGCLQRRTLCQRHRSIYRVPTIFIMLNKSSSSLIYGITQCSRLLVRRDGFHRENDVTATDTSFPQPTINANAICCRNTTDYIIHNITKKKFSKVKIFFSVLGITDWKKYISLTFQTSSDDSSSKNPWYSLCLLSEEIFRFFVTYMEQAILKISKL